jgi:hypothetical protein
VRRSLLIFKEGRPTLGGKILTKSNFDGDAQSGWFVLN